MGAESSSGGQEKGTGLFLSEKRQPWLPPGSDSEAPRGQGQVELSLTPRTGGPKHLGLRKGLVIQYRKELQESEATQNEHSPDPVPPDLELPSCIQPKSKLRI